MDNVKVIEGEIFKDYRGQISSLNTFHFEGVRRVYFIHHPDESVVRGWHGHRYERKWFYCVKGEFTVGLVRIDDWNSPSPDLQAEVYDLNDNDSRLLAVPAGYANCLKARTPDAVLMVLSDKTMDEAGDDSWRFDSSLWMDRDNIK